MIKGRRMTNYGPFQMLELNYRLKGLFLNFRKLYIAVEDVQLHACTAPPPFNHNIFQLPQLDFCASIFIIYPLTVS